MAGRLTGYDRGLAAAPYEDQEPRREPSEDRESMKTRDVVIHTGEAFEVPQGIVRIDHRSTHGWQMRYGGTKLFSDGTAGAGSSLAKAKKELFSRIAKLPAPARLQKAPSANKTNDLPVGIFGPVVRQRKNSGIRDCSLSVLVPRFGQPSSRRTLYIGNENTYTKARFRLALARAIEMRAKAEEDYRRDATRAKRRQGRELKAA